VGFISYLLDGQPWLWFPWFTGARGDGVQRVNQIMLWAGLFFANAA
jgi:hypothetical protein